MAYDWNVSWTTDGGVWHERGFHTFEEAQGVREEALRGARS